MTVGLLERWENCNIWNIWCYLEQHAILSHFTVRIYIHTHWQPAARNHSLGNLNETPSVAGLLTTFKPRMVWCDV